MLRSLVRMQSFLEVAHAGGVRAAATRLSYSPSTVAAHVRELKHQLRVRLLDRSESSKLLTPAGSRLLPLMEETVTAVTSLEREAALIAADSEHRNRLNESRARS